MWLVVAREPYPDAKVWPGRRVLAVVDAAAWPAMWMAVFGLHTAEGGLVAMVGFAVAGVSCLGRLRRAWWHNHRYRFTTWRWGRFVAVVWLFGLLLKLLAG